MSQTQTWTYDAAGRMRTAQDPDGTYTLAYDAAGRVSSVQEPFSLVLTFGYDAVGNRTSVLDSKGGTATMTFDARNMQSGEELGGSGITPVKESRTYRDDGRLDTTTRYKSSLFWTSVGSTTHAYDAAGRLTGITHKDGMMTALASYAYAYDAADRLTSETINGSQRTYTYDHTDQLATDAGTPYSYDANGNRTMTGYATGTGNRMSNDGTWTYTYDAEGNVTKKSKGAASDTWTYGYDHRNQMTTGALAVTDGGTVTQRVTYVYDAFGNRIERDAWDGSTAVVERFGMDGWDPAKPKPVGFEQFDAWADLDGSNALAARRNYAPGFDEITVRQSAGGTVGWYLTDHLGSVRGVTNGDGTSLTTISYDAWGQVLSNSTPGSSDRYLYTGREWDSVMGLWYYRARMRGMEAWYSEDPSAFVDGPNHYVYGTNSPLMQIDPSGRQVKKREYSVEDEFGRKDTAWFGYESSKFKDGLLDKLTWLVLDTQKSVAHGLHHIRELIKEVKKTQPGAGRIDPSTLAGMKPDNRQTYYQVVEFFSGPRECTLTLADVATVEAMFNSINVRLRNGEIIYSMDDLDGDAAEAAWGKPNAPEKNVTLANTFFDKGAVVASNWARIGVLTHEVSHLFGTDDYGYYAGSVMKNDVSFSLWAASRKNMNKPLALTTQQLLNNADSYGKFIETYYAKPYYLENGSTLLPAGGK